MIPWPRLLADVWALFRRERELIVGVAGLLVFLPTLAVQLLADPLPAIPAERTAETIATWLDAVRLWGQGNAAWYLLADVVGLYGLTTIALLFLDPRRPDVGSALHRAVSLFPRFALASVLAAIPVGFGLWMLILPGLFAQARLLAVPPALAAEQPLSASRSLARSLRVTAPASWTLFAAVVTLFLMQAVAVSPLQPLDIWLRTPSHANPFVLALVDAGLAAVATAYHVAVLLLGIVAYRRFANSGT